MASATAAEINMWRNPGARPYAAKALAEMSEVERREAFTLLKVPAHLVEQMVKDTGKHGEAFELVDGQSFDSQLFRVNGVPKVVHNLVVAFERTEYDRHAERWSWTDRDGRKYEITDPFICHNISFRVVAAPPPPKIESPCAFVSLDYRTRGAGQSPIVYDTPDRVTLLQAWANEAQGILYPDSPFAFVLVHLDLTAEELQELKQDECFGYGDDTGFHTEVARCLKFCADGVYPPKAVRDELARTRGIRLPQVEPGSAFMLPLAGGVGYLRLPKRFAARFGLYCVGVAEYPLSVFPFWGAHSSFAWDIVERSEWEESLQAQAGSTEDAALLTARGDERVLRGVSEF
jgi:hypothetical protein